jgi:hypothetical protein
MDLNPYEHLPLLKFQQDRNPRWVLPFWLWGVFPLLKSARKGSFLLSNFWLTFVLSKCAYLAGVETCSKNGLTKARDIWNKCLMYALRSHGDQVRVGPHMTNNIVFAKLDILTLHGVTCCDFWLCDCQLTTLYGKVAAKLSQLRALGPTLGGHTNQYTCIPLPKCFP